MASITALLHTHNDALRLGRALETLYACDEILLVDHGSRDDTVRIARQYGAKVVEARPGASPEDYLRTLGRGFGSLPPASSSASKGWILCLDPHESLTEKLAATLFEWKSEALHAAASAFSVFLREETAEGWMMAQEHIMNLAFHWFSVSSAIAMMISRRLFGSGWAARVDARVSDGLVKGHPA